MRTEPGSTNPQGQIDDPVLLKKERIKFGLGTILFQSEEVGIGGVPTQIIRSLGGGDTHVGIYGSYAGISCIAQFFGAFFLRKFQSNRKAMIATMWTGFCLAALIAGVLLVVAPGTQPVALWLYIGLALLFAGIGGTQWNIESGWIGDLVPKNRLGWFTSARYLLSIAGVCTFTLVFGRLADAFPTNGGYAAVYLIFCASFLVAALVIYPSITDRTPIPANYFSAGANGRLNYRSSVLWLYILFYSCWAGGRAILMGFMSMYLIEAFHFTLTKIAWIFVIQYAVSILMVFFMGKITDRSGHRMPLIIVSTLIGLSMYLWCSSAFLGVVPIIVYMVINGASGATHGMLAVNFGLEIFPAQGRAAYLGISRLCMGIITLATPALAGLLASHLASFSFSIGTAVFSRYHILFFISATMTLCCALPLFLIGNRRVEPIK